MPYQVAACHAVRPLCSKVPVSNRGQQTEYSPLSVHFFLFVYVLEVPCSRLAPMPENRPLPGCSHWYVIFLSHFTCCLFQDGSYHRGRVLNGRARQEVLRRSLHLLPAPPLRPAHHTHRGKVRLGYRGNSTKLQVDRCPLPSDRTSDQPRDNTIYKVSGCETRRRDADSRKI